MRSAFDVARARRAQIVSLSLTELMLLLVFMAITFSFLSRDENAREVDYCGVLLGECEERLATSRSELADREDEIRALKNQLSSCTGDLAQCGETLRPDSRRPTYGECTGIADCNRAIARLSDEIARLTELLKSSGKAPGLPVCTQIKGFIAQLHLLSDGTIQGLPSSAPSGELPSDVDGALATITSGVALNERDFRHMAATIAQWGLTQTPPCRLLVKAYRVTDDAGMYERLLRLLEEHFYVKRVAS